MELKVYLITDPAHGLVGYLVADNLNPHEIPWKRVCARQHHIIETDMKISDVPQRYITLSLVDIIPGKPIEDLYPEIGGII